MAGHGDPKHPDDLDDLIGFSSPASLAGRPRVAEPEPEPEAEPEPVAQPDPEPVVRAVEHAPDPEIAARPEPSPRPEPPRAEAPPETPVPDPAPVRPAVDAASVFQPAPGPKFGARKQPPAELPEGGMGLFAVYALTLFAVPTLGASAVIALVAVTGRPRPADALSASHFIYQQRTLWAAAVVAVAGVILLAAPFALGVPILFALAIWLIVRGAAGVWALKAGRPIANPRGWWVR